MNTEHYTDMTDEQYFASPAIDQSQLKTFLKNPAEWGWNRLHPNRREPTESMKFGTAFHAYIMNTIPVVSLDEGQDFRNRDNRAWRDEQTAAGNIVVTHDQMQLLQRMRDNLKEDAPELWDMVEHGYCENTIFWTDRKTGLRLKAKPDLIPNGADFLVDFKTAQSASARDFHREAVKYGYHIQALFYRQAVAMCAPNLFDRTARMPQAMQFWVFEKTGACDWQPFSISADNPIMDSAKEALRQALTGIATMIELAAQEGLGDDVDAAAQYAVRHGYGKHVNELEFTAADLLDAQRMIAVD